MYTTQKHQKQPKRKRQTTITMSLINKKTTMKRKKQLLRLKSTNESHRLLLRLWLKSTWSLRKSHNLRTTKWRNRNKSQLRRTRPTTNTTVSRTIVIYTQKKVDQLIQAGDNCSWELYRDGDDIDYQSTSNSASSGDGHNNNNKNKRRQPQSHIQCGVVFRGRTVSNNNGSKTGNFYYY